MKIWKYQISNNDIIIKVPGGKSAQILSLQLQDNVPTIWVLVNPEEELAERRFVTFVTGSFGNIISNYHNYIGTYQIDGFVGHVFEIIE